MTAASKREAYAGTAALPAVWRGAPDVRGRGMVALGCECAECGEPMGADGWAANMDASIAGAGGDVRPIGQALACAECESMRVDSVERAEGGMGE